MRVPCVFKSCGMRMTGALLKDLACRRSAHDEQLAGAIEKSILFLGEQCDAMDMADKPCAVVEHGHRRDDL